MVTNDIRHLVAFLTMAASQHLRIAPNEEQFQGKADEGSRLIRGELSIYLRHNCINFIQKGDLLEVWADYIQELREATTDDQKGEAFTNFSLEIGSILKVTDLVVN